MPTFLVHYHRQPQDHHLLKRGLVTFSVLRQSSSDKNNNGKETIELHSDSKLNVGNSNKTIKADTNAKSIMKLDVGSGKSAGDDKFRESYYERNFITALRAMQDFLLKPEHLEGLRVTYRRSPHDNSPQIKVYWRKDVEAKSRDVWGSHEALEREHERREAKEQKEELVSFYKRLIAFERKKGRKKLDRESWPVRGVPRPGQGQGQEDPGLQSESGKVVLSAIAINSVNCVGKGVAWVCTGSHALFSEMIHSAADTLNQIILAYGIKKSTKMANKEHPYGYSQMQYVSSLISAVGIFCMGAGLSIYHGIEGEDATVSRILIFSLVNNFSVK